MAIGASGTLAWRRARPRLVALVTGVALSISSLAAPAPAGASGPRPAAGFPGTVSSTLTAGIHARPHDPLSVTRHTLAPRDIDKHASSPFGSATTHAHAATTVTNTGGLTIIRSAGSLSSSAHCSHTFCDGDLETADVWAFANAEIEADLTATGDIPYRLELTIHANGVSQSPCAGVAIALVGTTQREFHAVSGPIAADPDCVAAGLPHSLHATREGVLTADGTVSLIIDADTSFVDPGTQRTDGLHSDWNVVLKLGPLCTISATDDPNYDPVLGGTIQGTSGNDVICGGDGPDIIHGNGGVDQVFGSDGADTIDAAGSISGGSGADYLCGSALGDTIQGGNSADTILGGPGADVIDGGTFGDSIYGDSDPTPGGILCHVPSGPPGADHLIGGPDDDLLQGDGGGDTLSGGPGKDTLDGGAAKDTIAAGPDADTIRAHDGLRDVVDCGTGDDHANLDHVDLIAGCEHRSFTP